jgi:hypothetical protein
MYQYCTNILISEEPDEGNLHVRICGGIGWATADSTRNLTQNLHRFWTL